MPAGGKSYKIGSKDQIGKGAAKKATKQVESRKRSNRSALDFARKMTMRQGTDSNNPRPKR